MTSKFFSCSFLLFMSVYLNAQHSLELYNDGALLHVQLGAELHVLGDVHMRGASGRLENNGLLVVQGDMYGDNLFQQRGTGTTRLINNLVNVAESQKISGSYALRGSSQALVAVDDGSFYNLELANSTGVVWLETNAIAALTPYVADVRNAVDFNGSGSTTVNRIITHNPSAIPANGSDYSSIFGMVNPNQGMASLIDNTISLNGNISAMDVGYVQGKFRRAINAAGGIFGFPVGLEPAGSTAQRGVQFVSTNFQANNYNIIECYFQRALPNTMPIQAECTGYSINYWGGADHGQWVFTNPAAGAGAYSITVYPQDHNMPTKPVWVVTKDNTIQGTANECGSSPIALTRSGYSGFSASSFGVAAAENLALPTELVQIWSQSLDNFIRVNWLVASEHNVSHYNLERSTDGVNYDLIHAINAAGNSTVQLNYMHDDFNVQRNQLYYYRYRVFDYDGTSEYSPVVTGKLMSSMTGDFSESVDVYPNPSIDNLTISVTSSKISSLTIQIYNALGQLVLKRNGFIENGNSSMVVDVEKWSAGMYQIELTDEISHEKVWKKFIKQ